MSENITPRAKPWHLWVVGIVSLLWNSFGCYDYVMYMTKKGEYLQGMGLGEEHIAYYASMPVWMNVVWAIGVWGALLGSLCLLLRSKWAFEIFIASLLGYVGSLIYGHVLAPMPNLDTTVLLFEGLILVGCVFLVWYAHSMRKAGHLR